MSLIGLTSAAQSLTLKNKQYGKDYNIQNTAYRYRRTHKGRYEGTYLCVWRDSESEGFWIFKLPDRYVRRTWLMEYVKTVRGTYVPIKCYLKRLSFESVKRVMKVENIIEEELKAKCHEYKKKSGKAE